MTERCNGQDNGERGAMTHPGAGEPVVFGDTADSGLPPAQGLYDPLLDKHIIERRRNRADGIAEALAKEELQIKLL